MMPKSAIECKDRRTRGKWFCFSESEMDVARQLIQLSGEPDDRHNDGDGDDNKDGCAEGKVEKSKGGDTANVSSTNNNNVGETFEEDQEEDADCILWRRKRRFRSVYYLYRSTKPVTAVNDKIRRKCAV
ncbi:hypothetical protein CIPAW_05G041800 [Carya illinoinensis]|uniref:Uncharacterized protein n=1 Tax=Carya illinoinensis TaxID=32201 RepID=A0A8T1QEX0_CARIL|nr:hypothetical protein CIPAW_05G041800 [Carya illinoinensis]